MAGRPVKKFLAGQSAVELAIFGSIVLFVIGLIFKVSLEVNQNADIALRVFRMALHESYVTANGRYAGQFSGARNMASFLLIEDRLVMDPSEKARTRDRTSLVAQGGGTMSHTLFMEVDPNDAYDTAVFDAIINGQRFPFVTSANTTKSFAALPLCVGWGYGPNTGACRRANGSLRFFRKVYNGEPGWSESDDTRFDLNFDGVTDVSSTDYLIDATTPLLRSVFNWQWVPKDFANTSSDTVPQEKEELDIDGDWKIERVIRCTAGASCLVSDSQDGDIDMTFDETTEAKWALNHTSPIKRPGLDRELRMYSFTDDNTMLRNEEGTLYSVAGHFIRNETRQDHVDIVERAFYLSNNTGRFCSGPTTVRSWGNSEWAKNHGVYGLRNPVEVCGNCFRDTGGVDNRKRTCMDTELPAIFIRSRIRDKRRSRWITRTDN